MKKSIQNLMMAAAIVVLPFMFTSCEDLSDDNGLNPAGGGKAVPFSAVISTPAGTRGLTEATDGKSISAKWEKGEQIALIHGKTVDVMKVASVDDKGVATIEGTITGATEGDAVHVVYVGSNGMENFQEKLNNVMTDNPEAPTINKDMIYDAVFLLWSQTPQLGTLAAINDGLDYRYASSTLTCPGSVYTFKTAVTPESQLAVWKISLADLAGKALSATELSITDGAVPPALPTLQLSVKPKEATSEMYVVMPDVSSQDLTITATEGTFTYTITKSAVTLSAGNFYRSALKMQKIVDLALQTSDYEAQDDDILTGTLGTEVKISIAAGATVTLKDANINMNDNGTAKWITGSYAGITCLGDATINLEGTNKVHGFANNYAGVQAAHNDSGDEYTLTIQGNGSLEAVGSFYASGIGSGWIGACGNITISGGTITATGGNSGAGIGSGNGYSGTATCGDITISGGTITATGGHSGAGIGSGNGSDGTATCGDITISGGEIKEAKGGSNAAGIGSSYNGACGNISIEGGTITATGGDYGAGIGSGNRGTFKKITITGGEIKEAKGGSFSAGIGSGNRSTCGDITISGATTKITSAKSVGFGAGIGSGNAGTCGDITISGGTITSAQSGGFGAGIGSGNDGTCGAINISGGTIESARGGYEGAGIGSGDDGTCGAITITTGVTQVTATKGTGAPNSIGRGGNSATCGTVTIEAGANVIQN